MTAPRRKIVCFAYDFFIDAIKAMHTAGHDIVRLYSFDADNIWNHNKQIVRFAAEHAIPLCLHKPKQGEFDALLADDPSTIFLSVAYPYKIPTRDGMFGVNVHPTLLPAGRSCWPLPWLILKYPHASGLTAHKLTAQWDAGDVLTQIPVPLTDKDDLETLSAKMQLAAPEFCLNLLDDFEALWADATPQDDARASY